MKEQLALPEPYGIGDVEIDSSILLDYLKIYDESFFKGNVRFSSTLDLEAIEPYLRQLRLTEQLDYIHSQEVRDRFDAFELDKIPDEVVREIERQRRNVWKGFFQDQSPVERGQTIYYDHNNDTISATSIEHGKFTETTADTLKICAMGFKPLFELHTHPFNHLFSPQDYLRMIWNLSSNRPIRLLKGAIVLCPDYQIMALATPKTLLLTSDNLSANIDLFLETNNISKSDIGKRINDITNHLIDTINRPFKEGVEIYINSSQKMGEEYEYHKRGLYSENEIKTVTDKLLKKYQKDVKEAHNKASDYADSPEIDAFKSERNLLYIRHGIELARGVNPRLFLATDFRHFKEFSA